MKNTWWWISIAAFCFILLLADHLVLTRHVNALQVRAARAEKLLELSRDSTHEIRLHFPDLVDRVEGLSTEFSKLVRRSKGDIDFVQDRIDLLRGEFEALVQSQVKVPAKGAPVAQRPGLRPGNPFTPPPPMKQGIPASVYDRIAASAAERHPVDFSTQEYVIRTEIEAYKKLRGVE